MNTIQVRILLLYGFIQLACFTSFCQFYPVSKTKIDASSLNKNFNELEVQSFTISNLITVKEFREYLDAVKKDSASSFYASQLPKSREISEELVRAILTSEELQNKPMPGVSWSVARNYCTWLSEKSKRNGINYLYDLPFVSQIMAFSKLYPYQNNYELESWTLNSYDESAFEYIKTLDYYYAAQSSDLTALKRKVIYNGSYHMNYIPNSTLNYLQYEYQDSSSRFVGFRIVRKIRELNPKSISFNTGLIDFNIENNKLEGIYQEKYANGRIKVLGSFSKGQRTDVWSIWDNSGNLKIQRNYTNNRSCDFMFPINEHTYTDIYSKFPAFVQKRNSDQYYPYQYVEERAVAFSLRLWRELSQENEPELFRFLDVKSLISDLFENDAKWYVYGIHGDFKTEVPKDSLPSLQNNSMSWDFSRIEMKEDFFFNTDILLGDTRPICISFYKSVNDTKPSYTVYFPHIRSILAKYKVDISERNEIKNVDDIFYFNAYRGFIVHRNGLPKNENLELNDLQIELEKFSNEHDLWLSFQR